MSVQPPPLPSRKVEQPKLVETERSELATTGSIVLGVILLMLIALVVFWVAVAKKPGESIASGEGEQGSSLVDTGELGGSPKGNPLGTDPTKDQEGLGSEGATEEPQTPAPESKKEIAKEDSDGSGDSIEEEEESVAMADVVLPIYVPAPASSATASNTAAAPNADNFNPFATGSEGVDVVFIIDKSSSMEGGSLVRVCRALVEAIQALKKDQKFSVIFFDHVFYTAPLGEGLHFANDQNKKQMIKWVETAVAGGGTFPMEAVFKGLEFNPEKIIVLSDGEFDPLSVSAITQQNQARSKKVVIDCIGLVENIITLQELAKSNQGIYYQAK